MNSFKVFRIAFECIGDDLFAVDVIAKDFRMAALRAISQCPTRPVALLYSYAVAV